ncbi:hypothetical protein SAMN05444166_5713 [Singulisphaera sp. GP187]|nr:hypothetical protein SAMN05444166_5713 [Singulisphaera sp. GP187]
MESVREKGGKGAETFRSPSAAVTRIGWEIRNQEREGTPCRTSSSGSGDASSAR